MCEYSFCFVLNLPISLLLICSTYFVRQTNTEYCIHQQFCWQKMLPVVCMMPLLRMNNLTCRRSFARSFHLYFTFYSLLFETPHLTERDAIRLEHFFDPNKIGKQPPQAGSQTHLLENWVALFLWLDKPFSRYNVFHIFDFICCTAQLVQDSYKNEWGGK